MFIDWFPTETWAKIAYCAQILTFLLGAATLVSGITIFVARENAGILKDRQTAELRADRTISNIARSELTLLLGASGKHHFQLIYRAMDTEAEKLAYEFNSVFKAAGWEIVGQVQPQIDLTQPQPIGVVFGVKSQQELPTTLIKMIDILRDDKLIGPRATVGYAPELPDNQSIAVIVGQKPK